MLWKSLPEPDNSWEPLELRELKKKLANVKCECSTCEKYQRPISLSLHQHQHDQNVEIQPIEPTVLQSKDNAEYIKPAVVLVCDETTTEDAYIQPSLPSFNKENMCSSCYLTLNLLRNGVTKILKDEEVETKPALFCDKATSKKVKCLEKTTSYCKPSLKYPPTSPSEDGSVYSQNRSPIREVTFAFNDKYYGYDDTTQSTVSQTSMEQASPEDEALENYDEEEETSTTIFDTAPDIQNLSPPVSKLCKHWIDVNEIVNNIRPPAPFITKYGSFQ